ncbi:MAG: hypothetical protein ACAI25_16985, partial [Planctomycetota bacterium]
MPDGMPDPPAGSEPAENLLRGLREHESDRALADTVGRTPPPEVAAAQSDPARRLGAYVLLDELGRGGMGVVQRAYDT